MKKVLFIATVVKIHIMTFHLPYLEWFKKNGYEVHVCAKNDYKISQDLDIPHCDKFFNIPFERSPFKINNIKAFKKVKAIIDENNYDIIHCHTPVGGLIGRMASKKARARGTQVFYTAHGFHFYKGAPFINWLLYYPVERFMARRTDVLLTINEEDYLRAKNTFKANRIEYIPGVGLDTKFINQLKISRSKKRKSLGISEESFVLVSVGELNQNKNHETIIKALYKIKNSHIHYIICGQGHLENHLTNLAISLEVKDQIHILGFRTDVIEILKSSDVFVFPSYREGLSISLLEAMASGLPVICSDIRGNKDVIINGVNGYLVEPDNEKLYVNYINELFINKKLRGKMGDRNINKANKYSIEEINLKLTKIYNI